MSVQLIPNCLRQNTLLFHEVTNKSVSMKFHPVPADTMQHGTQHSTGNALNQQLTNTIYKNQDTNLANSILICYNLKPVKFPIHKRSQGTGSDGQFSGRT
jgi:hypothetical protein